MEFGGGGGEGEGERDLLSLHVQHATPLLVYLK